MKIYRPYGRCNISGERVREARERADLSQERLAYKIQIAGLDITQKAISRGTLSPQEVKAAEAWLNSYPRKMFGFLCSEQLFREELALILAR